jgi:pectate lyase
MLRKYTFGLAAVVSLTSEGLAITAFPGAEGFGAGAEGGRGGDVFIIDSLADAGPGTLRECVEAAGPRTCVFAAGGTIELDSMLIARDPYMTIAGQTAPGGGIAVRNSALNSVGRILWITRSAHDVIVRHIRFRPGPTADISDKNDAVAIDAAHVILDHVSLSWSTDEIMESNRPGNVTVQWSMLYEGLNHSTHSRPHSKGPNLRGCEDGISLHHNVIANNVDRNPNLTCAGRIDLTNNIVYHGKIEFSEVYNQRGDISVNALANFYVSGPLTMKNKDWPYGLDPRMYGTGDFAFYLPPEGDRMENLGWGMPDGSRSDVPAAIHNIFDPAFDKYIQGTPIGGALPVQVDPSSDLTWQTILDHAGAFPRDEADARIVTQVIAGREWYDAGNVAASNPPSGQEYGEIIDHPSEVGGWPVLAGGSAPADADRDGMADHWEKANGLDSDDPHDRNGDDDGDGYTNLEEYLSDLAGDRLTSGNLPPTAPTDLVAKEVASTRVELGWKASFDPDGVVDHYDVRRDGVVIGWPTDTGYMDAEVFPGTTYSYTVEGFDDGGLGSGESAPLEVTTPSGQAANEPPSVPTGLLARTVLLSVEVALMWIPSTDPDGSIARYDVFRDGALVGSSPDTSFTDTSVEPEQTYRYTVAAVDDDGATSGQSSAVEVTMPAQPTGGSNGGGTSGWLTAEDGAEDGGNGGKIAWSFGAAPAIGIVADDGIEVAANIGGTNVVTRRLRGSEFGLAVPTAPRGIEVRFSARVNFASRPWRVEEVRLVRNGEVIGESRAADDVASEQEQLYVFGGPDDLWGLVLTAADVNDADFGFVAALRSQSGRTSQVFVDHYAMRVTW